MTIQEIKDRIDIVEVAESYSTLNGNGNRLRAARGENPIREDGSGDFDVYLDTQKYYDHGTGEGGDIVDFIAKVEKLNTKDAVSFLQAKYLNDDSIEAKLRPLPRKRNKPIKKDNEYLLAQLETRTNKYLSASPQRVISGRSYPVQKWGYFPVKIEDKDGNIETLEAIKVCPVFEKLFEGWIIPTDKKFAKYLFSKVIGYCEYFNCPAIILRDESETVVDIIMYRPERDGKPLDMKYLYTRSAEKPDSNYIFPLQAQMMKIIYDTGVSYIGEGLKNSLNASILGIPFVSIEGAGNIKPELIEFLKSERMRGIKYVGAFDGDGAGERAYKKIGAVLPMKNKFNFESGVDFTDFLKEIRKKEIDHVG